MNDPQGLSKVAHAIRRSAALDAALRVCDPEAPVGEVLEMADVFAGWLLGNAGKTKDAFIGKDPWADQ